MLIESLYEIYRKHPSVQTDTRLLIPGDIFFALRGDRFNGNEYALQAIEKGASFAVVDDPKLADKEKCIFVEDVLSTLQQLAAFHRQTFSIPFIAITGSNGKTTTKELLTAVLSKKFKTAATRGNLNNHIGIPLTILRIPSDAEMAVIEMGANHQLEIAGYCPIAQPTHALINNVGKAHLEGFGGIEGVRKGKGELYDFIRKQGGTIFRNVDLDYLKDMAAGINNQVTYGEGESDYRGLPLLQDGFAGAAILTPRNECRIISRLVGSYNFSNIMGAFAVGRHFGVSVSAIKEAIETYNPDNSRSQLLQRGSNTIILDAYNANPSSMSLAIRHFASADYPNKVVLLAAMKELGSDSQREHQEIVDQLQQHNWNAVVLVGGDFETTRHPYQFVARANDVVEWLKGRNFQHTAFLVKGSRAYQMETVLNAFQI